MEANNFLTDVLEQFEDPIEDVTMDTEYKNLETWDSLTAAAIQATIEDKYGVRITDEDIRELKTFQDLYNTVLERNK